MTKRSVIYARVSTEEQSQGYSLTTQIEKCQEYAKERKYTIAAEFQDAHTGTELDRPGLNELYQFIEDDAIDVLIVYDLDRLAREVGTQAIIEMEMSQAGIKIEYVLGQYADTPEGELMKLVKAGIAQYENRQRAERSRRGKLGRAAAGFVICPGGRAPFGYDYKSEPHKGWFVINEREAQVVRRMYKWLIEDGLSSYAIAKKLWEENILTKGDYSDVVYKKTGRGEWSPSTVRRIISSPTYKGEWYYGKTRRQKVGGKTKQVRVPRSEWIMVPVPSIVDEDTWETAQERLAINKQQAKRNTRRKYLLRSMVFCPCGRRRVGIYKNHLKRAYYRCPSTEAESWRHRCEYRFSIRQEILENAVWNEVSTYFLEPDSLRARVAALRAESEAEATRKQERLQAAENAIADVDRKMGVLLDQVLVEGFAQSVIDERKQQLSAQRAQLEVQKEQIQDELAAASITPEQEFELVRFAEQVRGGLSKAGFEEKRRLLELLRLRVDVIDRTHVKLSGVIPVSIVDLSST